MLGRLRLACALVAVLASAACSPKESAHTAPADPCAARFETRFGRVMSTGFADPSTGRVADPSPTSSSDAACTSFVGETGVTGLSYWAGRFEQRQITSSRVEVSARFSRPTAEADLPVEIVFRGGTFGVATGGYFFWEGEKHWTGWLPTTARVDGENKLTVRQTGVNVEAFLNDKPVGSFVLDTEPPNGQVGVAFKSKLGTPARVEVKDFVARDL